MKKRYGMPLPALTACFIGLLLCSSASHAWLVPDTGQTKCYDNTGEITCPTEGQTFYGQDANYTINPPTYTKLDASGNDLSADATEWAMVRDEVTGLIWEVKTDDGSIHDKDNQYTWYDGVTGTPGDGTDTKDFIDALNAAQFGGYEDWRMPTPKELFPLTDFGVCEPAINTAYFPNTVIGYWTSATGPFSGRAWNVYFSEGGVSNTDMYLTEQARAVRLSQAGSLGHFVIDAASGTVTDTGTGLMWQRGEAGQYGWEQALAYCESLTLASYTDWRLPSAKELQSLVDYTLISPAVDSAAFPDAASSYYWSSTTNISYTDYALRVYFYSGLVGSGIKSSNNYVRAVRAGQAGSFYTLQALRSGTGSGAVMGADGYISCGTDCAEQYEPGASVSLTAIPESGSVFTGWSGGGCSGTGTCAVTMNGDVTVTATFLTGGDSDSDGVYDVNDNCPAVANPLQGDADGDGIGDVCDPSPGCGGCGWPLCEGGSDTDGDTWDDAIDNCPGTYNPVHKDADSDGIGDCCDPEPGCGGCGQPDCDTLCSQ